MSELDDFVAEDVVETVETTDESQEAEASVVEPDTTETGVTAEPPAAEVQTEEHPEPTMVPLAAKQAEKDRRIAAEKRAEALEAQLNANKEKPDFYDDPESAVSSAANKVKTEISEALAMEKHEDYESVMDHYASMVKQNPSLHAQMMAKPLPALEAYKAAKKDLSMSELGDPEAYKAKLYAELEAKIRAELKAEKKTPDVPPDLTTVQSTGNDPKFQEIADGNEGLQQLLNR